uniref:Uncharacterized protein n=1 Tax=Caulobacter sp. (strain K31) TaxID=366602 RepID=B0T637_CAUSK
MTLFAGFTTDLFDAIDRTPTLKAKSTSAPSWELPPSSDKSPRFVCVRVDGLSAMNDKQDTYTANINLWAHGMLTLSFLTLAEELKAALNLGSVIIADGYEHRPDAANNIQRALFRVTFSG